MRTSDAIPYGERIVAVAVALSGIILIGGSVYVVAPLMLEHGWHSPRGLTFLVATCATLLLAGSALRNIVSRLRGR
jgi:hypothetical protein